MAASDLELREIWRWSGSILSHNAPSLIVVNDYIVVATIGDDAGIQIVTFDARTGNVLWKQPYAASNLPGSFWSVNAATGQIYVGSGSYVQSLDLHTGELLWIGGKERSGWHGSRNVYPKGDQLEVYWYASGNNFLYTLDAATGDVLEIVQKPQILFRMNGIDYEQGTRYRIVARDNATQQLLWEQEIGRKIQLWPIFIDNIMYVSTGPDYGIDDRQIFALSTQTGKIIWQSPEEFVSNIAFGQSMLFAIRGDASIVALDPQSGKKVGELTMTPAATYQYTGDQRYGDYIIEASSKFVVAYYKDSRELIVFEQTDIVP
jgi:outer membrane protein assembly factor BamB